MNVDADSRQIDALVGAFYGAFDNRGARTPSAADVLSPLHPHAVIAKWTGGGFETFDPAGFAEPRIELLTRGPLADFHEWETSSQTEIQGALATRRSSYRKQGLWSGKPYSGGGTKHFQLIKDASGWRILSVAWQDDA